MAMTMPAERHTTLSLIRRLAGAARQVFARPARLQFAALCYRMHPHADGPRPEILMITSRDTGRWVIPKGWPMAGRTGAGVAATEAYEEAGVRGTVARRAIGRYHYPKGQPGGLKLNCVVKVYALKVADLLDDFPERGERRRQWFSPAEAAARVDEPELAALLRDFRPPIG